MTPLLRFVDIVDGFNLRVGRFVMYGVFFLMAILLWSSISKTFFLPSLWTLELAQFAMVAYYMLGGPYSILMGSNVRMDLFYGDWSIKRKAVIDSFHRSISGLLSWRFALWGAGFRRPIHWGYWGTDPVSYFIGLITGTEEIGRLERSSSAWRPYIWPIKAIMIVGILMMLLQSLSELCKDILRLQGHTIPEAKE